MLKDRPKFKILVDTADPQEVTHIKELVGFVDGVTTNPTKLSQNPEVQKLIKAGHKFTASSEDAEYRKIVRLISPLVGSAGVSIEVFSDLETSDYHMLDEARRMFSWIPNAYIKFPCTHAGLHAAHMAITEGIRANITLVFSQEQAAAVYAATAATKEAVYVSPFIGRLDDLGLNGVDLIANIARMYREAGGAGSGNGAAADRHVKILSASVRNVAHVVACIAAGTDLITAPAAVWEQWAEQGFPMPEAGYAYKPVGKDGLPLPDGALKPIPFVELDLKTKWQDFNIEHPLTKKGIEDFDKDYYSTIQK